MTDNPTNKHVLATAHIISDLFSPLLAPTYATAIALWFTMLRYLPLNVKLWALGGILFITAITPALVIFILIRMGKVSNASISDKSQRTIPYCAAIVCYLGAGYFMHSMQAPGWLTAFFYGAAATSTLSLIITKWWKISAHTAGIAGVAAACYWLAFHNLIAAPMLWLTVTIALTGAMAWSRLYLRHHTPAQVMAGALLSFIIEFLALTFL